MRKLAFVALFLAACGDDTPGQNGNPAPPPPPPPPPAPALRKGTHIEDNVTDREKSSIRHQFKERDFAVEQNRDPFQSFVISPQQIGPPPKKQEQGPKLCKDDKVLANTFSVGELKLVGIVAEGIAHKALLMGGNTGYILKPGDCVGREKAVVKEITDDFLTMLGQPDPQDPNKPQEKFEKTLHPKQLAMNSPEVGFTSDPVKPATRSQVAPPSQPTPGSAVAPPQVAPPQPQTTTTTKTTVQVLPMQRTQNVPPPQAPTAPATITP